MGGRTRETATAPDEDDRWVMTHHIPVWRGIVLRNPHLFSPEFVAKMRREAGLVCDDTRQEAAK